MNSDSSKVKVLKITLNGVIGGVAILLIAFYFEAFRTDNSILISGFINVHKENPLFYFFDLLPFITGALAYFYGGRVVRQLDHADSLVEESESRNRKLYRFVERIKNGEIDAEFHADDDDVLGNAIVNLRDNL